MAIRKLDNARKKKSGSIISSAIQRIYNRGVNHIININKYAGTNKLGPLALSAINSAYKRSRLLYQQ